MNGGFNLLCYTIALAILVPLIVMGIGSVIVAALMLIQQVFS
jgi:hypothetical protein